MLISFFLAVAVLVGAVIGYYVNVQILILVTVFSVVVVRHDIKRVLKGTWEKLLMYAGWWLLGCAVSLNIAMWLTYVLTATQPTISEFFHQYILR